MRKRVVAMLCALVLVSVVVFVMRSDNGSQMLVLVAPQQRTAPESCRSASTAIEKIQDICASGNNSQHNLAASVQRALHWLCVQFKDVEEPEPGRNQTCGKAVMYTPIGRLGNLMGLYAIIYSYVRKLGVVGYVDATMWNTLHETFPHISLRRSSEVANAQWHDITYQQAEDTLHCYHNGSHSSYGQFYKITNYPDRNGIDVFHPYYSDLKKEFEFSATLQSQAQQFLHYARGNRTSMTFIGFHIRRTDYREYIQKNYNMTVPEQDYYDKCLQYYRKRFRDALFIVSSDDMAYVRRTFLLQNQDMVMAGNGALTSPGRDMAILAACNHSIVTVGTYGFWGAYLAGGTVLTPEAQTHQSRGDRGVPLLEIQLAGATNWIAIS